MGLNKKKCPEDWKTSHRQQSVYFRPAPASTAGAITVKTGAALNAGGVVMNNSSSFFVGRFLPGCCLLCLCHSLLNCEEQRYFERVSAGGRAGVDSDMHVQLPSLREWGREMSFCVTAGLRHHMCLLRSRHRLPIPTKWVRCRLLFPWL